MTVSPNAPPLVCGTLAAATEALRARGQRISLARRQVLEALFAATTPLSAQQIARDLGVEESSVYRNLELLERHGMIRHVHLGHGPGLYVRTGHPEAEWLFCERCATVTAIAPGRLDGVRCQLAREFGHHVRFTHFAMVGVCEGCATGTAPNPGG